MGTIEAAKAFFGITSKGVGVITFDPSSHEGGKVGYALEALYIGVRLAKDQNNDEVVEEGKRRISDLLERHPELIDLYVKYEDLEG